MSSGKWDSARIEDVVYRDEGCRYAPSCLRCPFPKCRYDVAGGIRAMQNEIRDAHMRDAIEQGESRESIAERFGVSRRTVYRVGAE